jgi:UDP:flavonoid glycosyltransferase YjiC (YdhE family)
VPMIVYSDGYYDRNGCAARVAYHGLGLRGDFYQDTPGQIAQKIDQVLHNPQFKANVERMRQIYLTYHYSDRIVQSIHGLLTRNNHESCRDRS